MAEQKAEKAAFGAENIEYDLITEMHELLAGNDALNKYVGDAQKAGDGELEQCFKDILEQNRTNVGKLRGILAKRLKS